MKQHSWPSYGWKAELAATLSLRNTQLGGNTLLKTDISGQFMLVGSANLWLLSQRSQWSAARARYSLR